MSKKWKDLSPKARMIIIASSISAGTIAASTGIATAIVMGNRNKLPSYLVTFKNWDDSVLYTQRVSIGGTASYGGAIPTRPTVDYVDYTFTGWDKPLRNILDDTTVTAQFNGVTQTFTTYYYASKEAYETGDDPIETVICDKGKKPTYPGQMPTKPQEGGKQFKFDAWDYEYETWETLDYQCVWPHFTEASEGLNFTTDNTSATITAYIGSEETLTIPDTWGSLPVTKIASNAFAGDEQCKPKKVIISANVTEIEDFAFLNNTAIEEIEFAEGSQLTSVGQAAFSGCTNLKTITLPESLSQISTECFKDCTGLESISLSNVTEIGTNAFSGCDALCNATVSDDNPSLVTNTTYAPGILFKKNEESNDLILYKCLPGVSDLKNLWQVSEMTTIGESAFENCNKITKVDLSKSQVSQVLDLAFAGSSITEFISSNVIEKYTGGCFKNCTQLTTFTLGSSVVSYGITSETLSGCSALSAIHVVEDNEQFESDGGVLYWKAEDNTTWLTCCPPNIAQAPTIKENCVGFDSQAFAKCNNLTGEIEIPSTVTQIGDYCFNGCENITKFTFKTNGQLTAGERIFNNCSNLTEIHFEATALISMSANAAALSGCHALTQITVDDANPVLQSIDGVLFTKPSSSIPQYLMRYPSSKDGTEYIIPENTIGVARQSFDGASNLEQITFPSTLKRIFANAFNDCTNLKEIVVSSEYTYTESSIDSTAFTGCTLLSSLTIKKINDSIKAFLDFVSTSLPESKTPLAVKLDLADTTEIVKQAFTNTWYLKSIEISDGIQKICESAFQSCQNLESVTLPNTLTTIDKNAFLSCSNLKNLSAYGLVTIKTAAFGDCGFKTLDLSTSSNLTTIYDYAFGSCSSLTEITLPASLTTIYKDAFNRCTSLTTVIFKGTKNQFLAACGGNASTPFTEKSQEITIQCSDGTLTA